MRTYSTIISLILLVAFANATKSVSYSDIVYSLMELNDSTDTTQSLENLRKINVSFTESKEKLTEFDNKLRLRCKAAQTMGANKLQTRGNQLIALEQAKSENLAKQDSIRKAQEAAKNIVVANQEEIRTLNKQIAEERAALRQSEKARAERYMIYRRLLNFVEDELASSAAQRKTEMGAINVDKSFSGKTAFVQLQRIRSDLTDISAKTADPMAKSMITTLLMITQDSNKSLFVDQDLVSKVRSLISTLMDKEASSYAAEKEATDGKITLFESMIETKATEADRKKEEELMNVAELASLEQAVKAIDYEIKSNNKAQEKQRKKNAVQDQICERQEDLIKLHLNDFALLETQFNDLKNNLA